MKTIKLIIVCLLLANAGMSQQKGTDSLLLVRSYLLKIKSAIPSKSSEVNQKMQLMQTLIRDGSRQQSVLERQLKGKLPGNTNLQHELMQQFKFVIQSAAILRSDLKTIPLNNSSVQNEVSYLNKHLPPLADKLNDYSKK